jgi:hypothetical protein
MIENDQKWHIVHAFIFIYDNTTNCYIFYGLLDTFMLDLSFLFSSKLGKKCTGTSSSREECTRT